MNKFLKYLGIAVIAAFAVPVLLILIYSCFLAYKNPPVPDWAGGLPNNAKQASKEWDGRIQRKFKVGDDAAGMVAILQDGHFEFSNTPDGKHLAIHKMEYFPCTDERRIVWVESSDRKIATIGGTFTSVCP